MWKNKQCKRINHKIIWKITISTLIQQFYVSKQLDTADSNGADTNYKYMKNKKINKQGKQYFIITKYRMVCVCVCAAIDSSRENWRIFVFQNKMCATPDLTLGPTELQIEFSFVW